MRWARTGAIIFDRGANWAGMVAAMVLFTWITAPRGSHFLGRTLDLGVVPLPIGLIIGRFGCMAAGCCYGRLTDSWLAMRLPDVVGIWAMRYPTRIMSAVSELLVSPVERESVIRMTRAVIEQMIMVSMNGPSIATNPSRAISRVLAAA